MIKILLLIALIGIETPYKLDPSDSDYYNPETQGEALLVVLREGGKVRYYNPEQCKQIDWKRSDTCAPSICALLRHLGEWEPSIGSAVGMSVADDISTGSNSGPFGKAETPLTK